MKLIKNWISNSKVELLFVCLTPFISLLLVFLFPSVFKTKSQTNTMWWIVLVLLIDVSHVYSTLYRTYFDKLQWQIHKKEMIAIPILSFLIAILLYQMGFSIFWRVLAYTAVFHFVRQQYGLLKVYDRSNVSKMSKQIHTLAIYSATLYPLVYWHCYGPFEFNWFTSNDFIFFASPIIEKIAFILYSVSMIAFLLYTFYEVLINKIFNLPVFLIILGTALSWYFGIVYFKSDLTFTFLNVIAHGIPYMALIWIFGKKQLKKNEASRFSFYKYFFSTYGLPLFLLVPVMLGFIEEGFWDSLVWNEHTRVFQFFHSITPDYFLSIKAIVIPLLVMPQLTHYILDGFIWKVSKGHLDN